MHRDKYRLKKELETMRLKYSYHHTLHKLKKVQGEEDGGGTKKKRKDR